MLALIAAFSINRVIGNKGIIPWKIANEKKRFKELTMNNIVIMGRRTYEEIGRPLPGRINIVISTKVNYQAENCFTKKSLDEALSFCRDNFNDKDIFISGGSDLYRAAIPFVEKMFITEIDSVIEGDTYFPEFDADQFDILVEGDYYEELHYRYLTYTRKA